MEEKPRHPKHHHEDYELNDMERYFAMTWGEPKGIAIILASCALFLVSIGVFLWLLHLANIIR